MDVPVGGGWAASFELVWLWAWEGCLGGGLERGDLPLKDGGLVSEGSCLLDDVISGEGIECCGSCLDVGEP